jgi:hypothetical protein
MIQGKSGPSSDSRCRHCRATNDPDAWECWLCSRRDWRGAPVDRPRAPEPAPPRHDPHRTTRGLPGAGPAPHPPRESSWSDVQNGMIVISIMVPVVFIVFQAGLHNSLVVFILGILIFALGYDHRDRADPRQPT